MKVKNLESKANLTPRNPCVKLRQTQMFLLVIITMTIHLTRNKIGHDCLLLPVSPDIQRNEKKSLRGFILG